MQGNPHLCCPPVSACPFVIGALAHRCIFHSPPSLFYSSPTPMPAHPLTVCYSSLLFSWSNVSTMSCKPLYQRYDENISPSEEWQRVLWCHTGCWCLHRHTHPDCFTSFFSSLYTCCLPLLYLYDSVTYWDFGNLFLQSYRILRQMVKSWLWNNLPFLRKEYCPNQIYLIVLSALW